ncbi:MAG: hypothetical protein IPG01_13155 [Chitinophagaceae bacterium]|nr:hypothetical protein [Chitinophagaceae bacterium]
MISLLEEKNVQLDNLLDKIAEAIQLDDTRYERMKSGYESVKDWIESDEVFFKRYHYDVYPHGSVRILTTVKPIGKDEFDLDIAIHLKSTTSHTPQRIYAELKRCIEAYAKKHGLRIEAKNRCIRLDYTGDCHMDILPGIQEYSFDDNMLKVPDRELNDWVSSNPRGYANWFLAQANLVKQSLLEKAMRAENLPADNFKNKKPLQRAVQLVKRYRDLYFQEDDTYKTSSIILTTIAGQFYRGQESIFDTVDGIISSIEDHDTYLYGRLKVVNPVNPVENFTDKWDDEPEYYEAFKAFSQHLHNQWQMLKNGYGVIQEGKILKGLFGEGLFSEAQKVITDRVENLRRNKNLAASIGSGILTGVNIPSSRSIKHNTFYGGEYEE